MIRNLRILALCALLPAIVIASCFGAQYKDSVDPNGVTKLSLDLGYLAPLALEAGMGVTFPGGIAPYTKFGLGRSGMFPNGQEEWGKGIFATWALGLRLRIPKLHFRSRFTNYFTIGYLLRDFYAMGSGTALDSLYSTDCSVNSL